MKTITMETANEIMNFATFIILRAMQAGGFSKEKAINLISEIDECVKQYFIEYCECENIIGIETE